MEPSSVLSELSSACKDGNLKLDALADILEDLREFLPSESFSQRELGLSMEGIVRSALAKPGSSHPLEGVFDFVFTRLLESEHFAHLACVAELVMCVCGSRDCMASFSTCSFSPAVVFWGNAGALSLTTFWNWSRLRVLSCFTLSLSLFLSLSLCRRR